MSTGDYYIVELDRWGIKNDGTMSLQTTQGINNAFVWAKDNGFQLVILPKGNYLIDKNSSVILWSNTHYKFYDCFLLKEANNLTGYTVIECNSIKNVTIEGLTVVGDRETHNYSSGGTHEWGHGITIQNSCYNILVKDCNVSECTGDGYTISMNFDVIGGITHPSDFAKGDIDNQGNLDTTKTNYTTVTKFYDITSPLVKSAGYFYYSGDGYGGYGTGCNLNKTIIKAHFYAANNTYLGFRNTRSYEFIYLDSLPAGTTKVRFSYLQNFDLLNGNLHYVSCAKTPQFITFLNCRAFKNRRLGASVCGGRFITFEGCELFNNSNRMTVSTGCDPGYGIDIEDGYMANQKITVRNCNIYDNRAGALITVSTRGVFAENNKFKGQVNFYGSGDDYLSVNNMYYGGINGRSITGGGEADGTFCTFRSDSIFGESCSILAGNTTLDNCVFSKSSLQLSGETVKIFNCKLTFDDPDKDGVLGFSSKFVEVRDSLFDIRRAKGLATVNYNGSEQIIFSNVKFLTNEFGGGSFIGTKNLIIENCEFIHTGTKPNYSRIMVSESMIVEKSVFKNQSFRFDGGDIYGTEKLSKDPGFSTHIFRNNKIIWDVPYGVYTHEARGPGVSFIYISRLDVIKNNIEVTDKNVALGTLSSLRVFAEKYLNVSNNTISTINTSGNSTKGAITIEGAYRSAGTLLPRPRTTIIFHNNNQINSNITFTNDVSLQLEKNILENTPLVSAGALEPTFGTYTLSQIVYNSNPIPGGYIGWVCTTAGTVSNSTWTAINSYSSNSRIYSGIHVYEAQNSGRSSSIAPTFPTGVNATVEDKVGTVPWVSKAYVVGNLVVPLTPNGYYYECTSAGVSGANQPNWSTTENSTVTDGTVVWTVRRIIIWKRIDTKAVFKKFGLISE